MQSFNVRRTSAQLGFEYPFAKYYRAIGTYSFDLEHLFDVDRDAIISEVDHGRLNMASVVITLQLATRDNIADARSSSSQRLSFEVANLAFGSKATTVKRIGTTQWFVPLVWHTVGHLAVGWRR